MPTIIDDEEYLRVDEVTAWLGVKRETLYAYVSRGVLRSYKQGVGRGRLYRRADIEALAAVRPGDAPSDIRAPEDDRVGRDVDLPRAETWAGEH